MVWLLLLLETVFVCLLIHCEETVQSVASQLSTYSTKLCPFLKKVYSLYSLYMFPQCLGVPLYNQIIKFGDQHKISMKIIAFRGHQPKMPQLTRTYVRYNKIVS